VRKKRGYWLDIEILQRETNKYTSRYDFKTGSSSACSAANKLGVWDLICAHMGPKGNLMNRQVYVYQFPDNFFYIGLTFDFETRHQQHLVTQKNSAVSKHVEKTGSLPEVVYVSELLPVEDAIKLEQQLCNEYEKLNIPLLNKMKAGGLGGGQKGFLWTIDEVTCESQKYNGRKEFKNANRSAFTFAQRNNLLNVLYPIARTIYTIEKCVEEAAKYNTRTSFATGNNSAYRFALRNNILEELTKHMNN
jgi:predicted GIY-YIG superfamily endonuclease